MKEKETITEDDFIRVKPDPKAQVKAMTENILALIGNHIELYQKNGVPNEKIEKALHMVGEDLLKLSRKK